MPRLLALLLLPLCAGYSVSCAAGDEHCFLVAASAAGTGLRGSYSIISDESPAPVRVTVTGPPPLRALHYSNEPQQPKDDEDLPVDGEFSFLAEQEGDYTICIANGDETHNDGVERLIAFNFRAVGNGFKNYSYPGLDQELSELKQGFEMFKDHQAYMNQREDVHRETLESINNKVIFWTLLEALVLVLMAYLQLRYIANFLETKRRL